MDENGNYIINAGSRSEYRVPKAEFEAQQKNAPTQTDMSALTKMLSEREANRANIALQGQQNPTNNPRADWNSANTQVGGITGNEPPANELMGFTPEQLRARMENTNSLLNRGLNTNAPTPDVDTPKAIGPKSNTNIYSQGQVVTSNANTPSPDQSGPTGTAKVAAPPQPINPNAPKGSKENPYRQGDIVSQNGKNYVWNEKGQNFMEQTTPITQGQASTGTTGGATQGGKIFTGNTIDPSKDPNNLPYNNPEANKPILPTSYTGQIALQTPPEEMQLMDYLKKQFEDKTWENKYADLQKQYQQLADRPDKYSGMIEKAGGEDVAGYIKSLYEGAADPLRREAQRMQEQNAADLAARGLGMSTVVSDVNNPVQRELMANLTDLSNRANVQGRDMYLNALRSAADVYGQHGAQQGNILNAMQTNIGNQMGAQQIGLANINDILAKQEARRLTNMQTGINQWDKDVANYWKYQYYPLDAYSGQNSTATTAANVGGQTFAQANQNAQGQNQLAGNVGATLAQNLFKQPQNSSWVPVGGLSGAQQGGSAGFSTKPKIGAFNQ